MSSLKRRMNRRLGSRHDYFQTRTATLPQSQWNRLVLRRYVSFRQGCARIEDRAAWGLPRSSSLGTMISPSCASETSSRDLGLLGPARTLLDRTDLAIAACCHV